MKIKKALGILAFIGLVVCTSACGDKKENETATVENTEESVNESETASEEETSETETTEMETSAEEESAKRKDYWEQWSNYWDYMAAKPKDQVAMKLDAESDQLYQDFLAGNAKATYDKKGDNGMYICLSEVLEDGKDYTLTEMEDKLVGEGQYSEGWEYELENELYIDAGLDGNLELRCDIKANEFTLTLIVKNIDGNLKLCFAGDSWSRCDTSVYYNGLMNSYGSGGAVHHGGHSGYIDADGDFHFWYQSWEDGIEPWDDGHLDYVDHYIGQDMYMWLESFSFDEEDGKTYYWFDLVEKNNDEIPENKSNPNDPYKLAKEALEEEGLTVVTQEAFEQMKDLQRLKIGFTDELYNYGAEYKPKPME